MRSIDEKGDLGQCAETFNSTRVERVEDGGTSMKAGTTEESSEKGSHAGRQLPPETLSEERGSEERSQSTSFHHLVSCHCLDEIRLRPAILGVLLLNESPIQSKAEKNRQWISTHRNIWKATSSANLKF